MDGLALLCNLHADGPLTLRRLRQAGVSTLRDLEGVPETTLRSWLGGPRARRFVEEARQLAGRLAEARLEPEEALEPSSDGTHAAEPRFSQRTGPSEVQGTLLRPGAFIGLDAETCELLRAHGVQTSAALVAGASLALARRTGISFPKLLDLSLQAQRSLTERPEEPGFAPEVRKTSIHTEPTSLRPGAIEGLEAETCARLSSHGVRTFEALVAETSLDLARRTGIPFPKLLDLSARARTLTERIELQPEPSRRAPILERFSVAPSVRTLSHSAPRTHALEKTASAAESVSRPRDPGVAGPFG